MEQDLTVFRREYTQGGLRRSQLPDNPLSLFEHWLKQACEAKLSDPTAMCIATVDETGQPYQRIVLLKHFDENGLVFYTNLGSRKAVQLGKNPKISGHFPWHMLDRQVNFLGAVEKLPLSDVARYFHCRPKESQIATWASKQSSCLAGRRVLEEQFHSLMCKFKYGDIPVPDFWGGYRIVFHSVEFWQGGAHRLNDRFLYERENTNWRIMRLAP